MHISLRKENLAILSPNASKNLIQKASNVKILLTLSTGCGSRKAAVPGSLMPLILAITSIPRGVGKIMGFSSAMTYASIGIR